MDKQVLIAGGSGFIGRMIVKDLLDKNYNVAVITRNADNTAGFFGNTVTSVDWKNRDQIVEILRESVSVINLSGANVMGKRWSSEYKELIRSSRVESTRFLLDCIKESGSGVESYISASAIGYYPRSEVEAYDEYSEPGDSYLAEVTRTWEEEAKKAAEIGLREVRIRTGIVLDKSGGALERMLLPFRLFAGGPIGSGRQWFSWIHAADTVNLYVRAVEDNSFNGAINASSIWSIFTESPWGITDIISKRISSSISYVSI